MTAPSHSPPTPCWYCGEPAGRFFYGDIDLRSCTMAHAFARAILHVQRIAPLHWPDHWARDAETLRTLPWTANGSVFPTSADVEISEPPHPFTFTQHEGKPWPSSAER